MNEIPKAGTREPQTESRVIANTPDAPALWLRPSVGQHRYSNLTLPKTGLITIPKAGIRRTRTATLGNPQFFRARPSSNPPGIGIS